MSIRHLLTLFTEQTRYIGTKLSAMRTFGSFGDMETEINFLVKK